MRPRRAGERLCAHGRRAERAFFEVVRAIRDGYDAAVGLSEAEKQALPDMIVAIELICVAAFADSEKTAHVF